MLTLQVIISGILLGGLYACMAMGFSLIWGVTNLINLAHGSMIIMGAYITWLISTRAGIDPFLTLPASAAALFVFGYLLQRVLLNRVLRTTLFMTLILTFGLNMLLVNVNLALFSADVRSITVPYGAAAWQFGDIRIPYVRVAVFAGALLLTLALHLFLTYARTGRAIRAIAQNPRAATILGIDIARMRAIAFGLGAAMAGAAGSLMAVLYAFSPVAGDGFTMKSFVIVVLGGLGSMTGAIFAGVLLGVAENLVSGLFVPGMRDAVSFILLVAILVLRPRGLFGKRYLADPRV